MPSDQSHATSTTSTTRRDASPPRARTRPAHVASPAQDQNQTRPGSPPISELVSRSGQRAQAAPLTGSWRLSGAALSLSTIEPSCKNVCCPPMTATTRHFAGLSLPSLPARTRRSSDQRTYGSRSTSATRDSTFQPRIELPIRKHPSVQAVQPPLTPFSALPAGRELGQSGKERGDADLSSNARGANRES